MTIWWVLGLVVFVPLIVVDGVLLVEIGCGLMKPRRPAGTSGPAPSIAILMPAHDEAKTLMAAGDMLRRLIATGTRIVVIADNCTDETAVVAEMAGCETVVRSDPRRRGKGHALAAGRDYLRRDPPEIVIVLDADCSIADDDLALLAKRAAVGDRAVQASYLLRRNPVASPTVQISNFAFAVKNLIRQRGCRRLGAAAILVGSGMAFPWRLIATLDLATSNVVEDIVLGIDLVRRDEAPVFEEHATVWSDASNTAGTTIQRSRWEGGFMTTARQFAWPLLVGGIVRRDFKQFWLGAHLLVPPLSIVLLINVMVFPLCAGVAYFATVPLPAVCAALFLVLVAATITAAWVVEGWRHVPARVLMHLPQYLGWKIALYWRLLRDRRSIEWIRTARVDPD